MFFVSVVISSIIINFIWCFIISIIYSYFQLIPIYKSLHHSAAIFSYVCFIRERYYAIWLNSSAILISLL